MCSGLMVTVEQSLKSKEIQSEMAKFAWPMAVEAARDENGEAARDDVHSAMVYAALQLMVNSYHAMEEKICPNCLAGAVQKILVGAAHRKTCLH